MKKTLLTGIISILTILNLWSQQLAFPTAEGYGKYTKGGRGGAVYEVTNLNDSGEGSLRAAVEAEGPRTVVFRVSGTIDLESGLSIENPFITIAGQTAPGDGITIKGHLGIGADNVIIRYIRIRYDGEGGAGDALGSRGHKDIIVDHVSTSWSTDEVMSIYICEDVTIQWSMITEALNPEGHGFGAIWGNNNSTYHHNLFAHNVNRNPRFGSGTSPNDFRNNVIYNWKYETVYGGENHRNEEFPVFNANIVANYYKLGPATEPEHRAKVAAPWRDSQEDGFGKWYIADNFVVGSSKVTKDNWAGVFPRDQETGEPVPEAIDVIKLDEPVPVISINQQTAEEAYHSVLENVGASLPKRDAVDERIIEEVRTGTTNYGDNGIIDSPSEVGGWPELASTPALTDSDHDGMPDEWEKQNSLNPNDASDRNTIASDGYTMLEKYLNSIR